MENEEITNQQFTNQQQIQQPKPKKVWLVLGLLILILTSSLIWRQWGKIVSLIGGQNQQTQPAINYKVRQVDHSILPQGLPIDIPLGTEVEILQNKRVK